MIGFEDKRWAGLKGGYKTAYDPRPALKRIQSGAKAEVAWHELWEELHHQGDIGEVAYAAVPHLVHIISASQKPDWNPYGLVSVIEIERHRSGNPPLPAWMANSYHQAWREVLPLALRDLSGTDDPITIRTILGVVALAKRQLKLGVYIVDSATSEIDEYLEDQRSWSSFYSEPAAGGNAE